MDYETLSHSKWDCKYHVVFIPKYRRKALSAELRKSSSARAHLRIDSYAVAFHARPRAIKLDERTVLVR